MKTLLALGLTAAALATVPASAGERFRGAVYSDSNPYWLDYQTDLSEARRELRNDLNDADDASDRADAWAEYRREVADARYDFAKEMREHGVTVRTGRGYVED